MSESEYRKHSTKPFAYDAADLRAASWQGTRWWALPPYLLIYGFLVWLFGSIMLEEATFDWVLFGLLCFITLAFAGPWTWRPFLEHWYLRRQGLLEPLTITIEPEHLTVHSDHADAHLRWSGITKINRTGERLFLFTGKSVAHIIPRRAFETEEQFDAFVDSAESHWTRRHRL